MVYLVLVRHGQSIWNLENRFTGWIDVSLSRKGILEAKKAGKILSNFKFDLAFTSRLLRAQETLYEILNSNKYCLKYVRIHDDDEKHKNWYSHFNTIKEDEKELKIFVSSALNERYYGDLQGLNKDETKKKYGEEKVQLWRRSFNICPPKGESLEDTFARAVPYYREMILPEIKKGKNIIISAHGNSLRAIIMSIENLTGEEILKVEIPTGRPIVYELDEEDKYLRIKSKKIL
jgi:2,3-bisphosphoglycerate-dependent phosphoglycerate mutase